MAGGLHAAGGESMRGRTLLFSAILPLVVIFLLAFYGTTSKQLTHFLQARAAAIKLATAGLFLTLAAWLFYSLT